MPSQPMRNFHDIGKTAVVAEVGSHWVEFKVYTSFEALEPTPTQYQRAGATSSPDPVDSIDDAEVYMHGSVKWDGCSNWYIDEQDRVMLHGCSRGDLLNTGEVMARCWDWAGEILDTWQGVA